MASKIKMNNAEKQYWSQRDFLVDLLKQLPAHVFWKNKDGIYLGCNDIFAKSLGFSSAEEIVGKNDYDLPVQKEQSDAYCKDDQQIMRSQQAKINIEEEQTFPDGKKVCLLTSKVPLLNQNNEVMGILGIYYDMTVRKKLEKDLKKAKGKAEAANHAKTEFIANMSHDIRTPLNGVVGMAELLEKMGASDQDREYGEMIHIAAQRLLELLNGILDIVSADHVNEDNLYMETFNLPDELRNLCGLMQVSTQAKGIELTLEMGPKLPRYIVSDRVKLHRILQNLLGNAIKFTHQGDVKLQAQLLSVENSFANIQFSITDTGIGIPKEQINKIFDRFFRVTPSYEGTYQGHGVGLYIVQKFVRLLGGSKVQVESKVRQGTRMHFSLKLKLGKAKNVKMTEPFQEKSTKKTSGLIAKIPEKPLSKPVAPQSLPRGCPQILFVEDNTISMKAGQALIQNEGCEVHAAESAEAAIKLFKEQAFDLVISDSGLPGFQGDEMASAFRHLENISGRKPTPIVALTAHAGEAVKANCLQAGMNKVYLKPLDSALAKNIIAEWLKPGSLKLKKIIQKKQTEIQKPATCRLGRDLPNIEKELFQLEQYALIDEKDGIKKLGDKSTFRKGLEMTLNQILPEEITNMKEAYLVEDWEKVEKIAHKMKGGSLYCGTVRMTYACQYLERYLKAGHRDEMKALYRQLMAILEQTKQAIQTWLDQNPK